MITEDNDAIEAEIFLTPAAFQFVDYMERRESQGLEASFQIIADPNVKDVRWEFPEDGEAILYCNPSKEERLKLRHSNANNI